MLKYKLLFPKMTPSKKNDLLKISLSKVLFSIPLSWIALKELGDDISSKLPHHCSVICVYIYIDRELICNIIDIYGYNNMKQ